MGCSDDTAFADRCSNTFERKVNRLMAWGNPNQSQFCGLVSEADRCFRNGINNMCEPMLKRILNNMVDDMMQEIGSATGCRFAAKREVERFMTRSLALTKVAEIAASKK